MQKDFVGAVLTVADLARIAKCHRSTVLRYEGKGVIQSERDENDFRRYTLDDAIRLKRLLSARKEIVTQYAEACVV